MVLKAADKAFGSVVFSELRFVVYRVEPGTTKTIFAWARKHTRMPELCSKPSSSKKHSQQGKTVWRKLSRLAIGGELRWEMPSSVPHTKGLAPQKRHSPHTPCRDPSYHDLRLGRAELQCTVEMVSLLKQAGQYDTRESDLPAGNCTGRTTRGQPDEIQAYRNPCQLEVITPGRAQRDNTGRRSPLKPSS